MKQCGFETKDNHGAIEYFCIDCWEPLCAKCNVGHYKFTKNHEIKLKGDLTRVDIVSSKRQTKSDTQPIKLYLLHISFLNNVWLSSGRTLNLYTGHQLKNWLN